MLFPTIANLAISLLFLCAYSLYVVRFSTWTHKLHILENQSSEEDLAKHFDESAFKNFEWGYQSAGSLLKICAVDSINHMPYKYQSPEDLDMYLRFPTAMNMSARFTFLLQSGFLISLGWVYFYLTYGCQAQEKKRTKSVSRNVKWYSALSLSSILHLYLLIYWRVYLKQGRICAGDFEGAKAHHGLAATNLLSQPQGAYMSNGKQTHHKIIDSSNMLISTNNNEPTIDDSNILIDITLLSRKVLERQLGISDQQKMNNAINLYQELRQKQIQHLDAGDGPKKKEEKKETKPKSDEPAPKTKKNDEHKNEKKDPKKTESKKDKKIEKPPAPKKVEVDNHIYIRKREGKFLYILAMAQIAAYILMITLFWLYVYMRFHGQMTPSYSRIETWMVDNDFKAMIEQIKEAKRKGAQGKEADPMEELDGVDGYNDGEDGVRDEFYDSHEDDKDKYKRF